MSYAKKERTLGELFSDLSSEMQTLLRQELLLARNEMTGKMARGANDLRSIALGGAVLYSGVLAIFAAAIALLAMAMPVWVAALAVGALASGAGYYMVKKGLGDIRRIDVTPRETVSTLKEEKKWLKDKAA